MRIYGRRATGASLVLLAAAAAALLAALLVAAGRLGGGSGDAAAAANGGSVTARAHVDAGRSPGIVAPAAHRRPTAAVVPQAARRLAVAVIGGAVTLCAKSGTATMPDSSTVPIWGFAIKPLALPCSDSSVTPTLPGPVLEVPAGTAVTVTLVNELADNVGLLFPGQQLPPDTTGAAGGGTKVYSFTASNPGTYLYEAGTDPARQIPMGLYGAFIVRPATAGQAYGTGTSYDEEAVLVLSEVDADLNAAPGTFNLLDYRPDYWLINGEGYPDTNAISTAGGHKVLLRYLNAGLQNHTMMLLGMHQRMIARDAYPLAHPFDVVADTIPSGQTVDMIATVPAAATSGASFALFNRQLHVTNRSTYPGGMLTFLTIP